MHICYLFKGLRNGTVGKTHTNCIQANNNFLGDSKNNMLNDDDDNPSNMCMVFALRLYNTIAHT